MTIIERLKVLVLKLGGYLFGHALDKGNLKIWLVFFIPCSVTLITGSCHVDGGGAYTGVEYTGVEYTGVDAYVLGGIGCLICSFRFLHYYILDRTNKTVHRKIGSKSKTDP